MTKEITITIQPCKSPVTITIHSDGKVVNSQDAVVLIENDSESIADFLLQRAKEHADFRETPDSVDQAKKQLERLLINRGGFASRNEICKKLYYRFLAETRLAAMEQIGAVEIVVRKGTYRPTTYCVLPDCVEAFKEYVMKQGWTIE